MAPLEDHLVEEARELAHVEVDVLYELEVVGDERIALGAAAAAAALLVVVGGDVLEAREHLAEQSVEVVHAEGEYDARGELAHVRHGRDEVDLGGQVDELGENGQQLVDVDGLVEARRARIARLRGQAPLQCVQHVQIRVVQVALLLGPADACRLDGAQYVDEAVDDQRELVLGQVDQALLLLLGVALHLLGELAHFDRLLILEALDQRRYPFDRLLIRHNTHHTQNFVFFFLSSLL